MGVSQLFQGYDRNFPLNQPAFEPPSERSSLAVVTGFLDAALQGWDIDGIKAKSQIRAAVAILRDYTDDQDGHTTHREFKGSGLAPWQARRVTELIESSLDLTIRLEDCASKVRLSASYFSRAFKATFGSTVGNYIRRRRVERAQQLMLLSNEPLSQIAFACGFADQAHYCRVFRSVVGLSPGIWRRHNLSLVPGD